MTKHNKKRNIGIIYELLIRHISHCLIENKKNDVKKATRIIEKRFKKGTELYKEFRLFNALAKSNITKSEIAAAILSEAKMASQRINVKKLDIEKSKLIKEINFSINDKNFYYRNIPHYREYGTIQMLLNEWRKGDNSNLKQLVEFENKMVNWLLTEKKQNNIEQEKQKLSEKQSNKLVCSIMTEKINEKYDNMTADQKDIIKMYAIYATDNNQLKLNEFLAVKKKEILSSLDNFKVSNDNQYVGNKIKGVREKINELNVKNVNDESIVKFLTAINLLKEIKE